jgi:predicted TIM-barrel fold metal-dependent hydrolase
MAELPFVDTHVHFFDHDHPELVWSWLTPESVHPLIGDIDGMKTWRFAAEEFQAETRFANVSKVVHVQAAIGSPDPVVETAWLDGLADRFGIPDGIVAHADLRDPLAGDVLERHAAASTRLRGIRDFSYGDYLVAPDWQRGYALLERFGLLCDLDCTFEHMTEARDIARRFPGIPLVLEHAGFPRARTDEYLQAWRAGMASLAEAENAWCKISGLGMCDPRWTVESLRPWVLGCIEAFGVERCFFGTNWPVDRLFSSYDPLIDAYETLIAELSASEREALFSANALALYRLDGFGQR